MGKLVFLHRLYFRIPDGLFTPTTFSNRCKSGPFSIVFMRTHNNYQFFVQLIIVFMLISYLRGYQIDKYLTYFEIFMGIFGYHGYHLKMMHFFL